MPEISGEIGKERILGGLLKTGQTTQYGGYLDDGFYEKGLSRQYTTLTLGQYAGTTSITVATKTDLISNSCVYDRRTKLVWTRYAPDGLGPSGDGKMPWTTDGNGHGIFPFVAAVNLANLANFGDWKIPSRKELDSLIYFEAPNSIFNEVAFPDSAGKIIWSGTTQPSETTRAFMAQSYGAGGGNQTKTTANYCFLVRGG